MVQFHVRVPARSGDFGHLKSLSRHRVCASIVHTMWCKKRCVCASIVHAECGTTPQGPRSAEAGSKILPVNAVQSCEALGNPEWYVGTGFPETC
jgi:hypothetical protein